MFARLHANHVNTVRVAGGSTAAVGDRRGGVGRLLQSSRALVLTLLHSLGLSACTCAI
jgi:hypothetical protein